MTHWQSPHFHAYFPAGQSYPSILGELLSAGLGTVEFTWVSQIIISLKKFTYNKCSLFIVVKSYIDRIRSHCNGLAWKINWPARRFP